MSEQGGDTRIELLRRFNAALKRIEALEAALREIAERSWHPANAPMGDIARAALAPERRHTTPEATDQKDWPKDGFINDYD